MRVKVAPSAIHGHGCFALEDFKPGEVIGVMEGLITTRDVNDEHFLYLSVDEDPIPFGIIMTGAFACINASKLPNVDFEGLEVVALTEIKAGDELLADYTWDCE